MKNSIFNSVRVYNAFKNTLRGLHFVWKNEVAFRQETCLLVPVLVIAFSVNVALYERMLLVLSWLFVMLVEIINTAIEVVINRISHDKHTLSGAAKDLGSSAVFFALLMAAIVWLVVLI